MPEVHRQAAEQLDDQLSGGFGRLILEKEQKNAARSYNDFCNSLFLLVELRGIEPLTYCLPDCFRFSFLFRVVSLLFIWANNPSPFTVFLCFSRCFG